MIAGRDPQPLLGVLGQGAWEMGHWQPQGIHPHCSSSERVCVRMLVTQRLRMGLAHVSGSQLDQGVFLGGPDPRLVCMPPSTCLLLLPQPHSTSFHPPTEQVHLFHRTFALASPLPGMLWSCWTDSSSDVCSKITFSGKASLTTPPQSSCQGEPASYLLPTQPLLSQPLVHHTLSLLTWDGRAF